MHQDVKEVSLHMSAFADEVLADALLRLVSLSRERNYFSEALVASSVAHGAEILIKSVLDKEHPLLLFEGKFYKTSIPDNDNLELGQIFNGITIPFEKLPYALWAATGYKISSLDTYADLKRARNKIMHLGTPPDGVLREKIYRFLFEVIDPIMIEFWENDLLSLVRPYYVEEVQEELRRIGVNLRKPEWLSEFDQDSERKELEEICDISRKQEEIGKRINRKVTSWAIHMSLIVPRGAVDIANREAIRITGNAAEKETFSVPLSSTGKTPATHYGAHTAATDDIAKRHVRLIRRHEGYYNLTKINSGTPDETSKGTFDSLCNDIGLIRVSEDDMTI